MDLKFANYYHEDRSDCKPVVFFTAGVGLNEESFPEPDQIELDPDISGVLKRDKAHLFHPTEVCPTRKMGKHYLQKEIIRRSILNGDKKKPAVKHYSIAQCIVVLKKNPVPDEERELIMNQFQNFKLLCRDHFMEQSGTSDAHIWRLVCLTECILSPHLRIKYRNRNDQIPRHVLCGRNTHDDNRPLTFYEEVANLCNSTATISSGMFSTELGEPFHQRVLTKQPGRDNLETGESVKKRMTKMRGVFELIDRNMKASGKGKGL